MSAWSLTTLKTPPKHYPAETKFFQKTQIKQKKPQLQPSSAFPIQPRVQRGLAPLLISPLHNTGALMHSSTSSEDHQHQPSRQSHRPGRVSGSKGIYGGPEQMQLLYSYRSPFSNALMALPFSGASRKNTLLPSTLKGVRFVHI